jgi:hypothetical protein
MLPVGSGARQIWKFDLRPHSIYIDIPKGARVLSTGAQGFEVVIWVLVDPEAMKVPRMVFAHPTGPDLPKILDERPGTEFIGTVQMDDGLVFHVFDGGE